MDKMSPVFIILFLFVEVGRILIKVLLKPSRLMYEMSDIADIKEVARPISSGVKSLEQIIQNTKPKTEIVPVESIRYIEFCRRVSW